MVLNLKIQTTPVHRNSKASPNPPGNSQTKTAAMLGSVIGGFSEELQRVKGIEVLCLLAVTTWCLERLPYPKIEMEEPKHPHPHPLRAAGKNKIVCVKEELTSLAIPSLRYSKAPPSAFAHASFISRLGSSVALAGVGDDDKPSSLRIVRRGRGVARDIYRAGRVGQRQEKMTPPPPACTGG